MDVRPPLIAHFQPPEAAQPGQPTLHDPAIAAQPLAGLEALAGDTRRDPALSTHPPIGRIIIGFIRMQFLGPLAWTSTSAPNRRDGIQGGLEHLAVVHVGCREPHCERESIPFDHKMALRAQFAAIRRVGAARFAPPGAGTLVESNEARDQSSRPASLSRWSRVWCKRSHTSACCQSWSRRQHVIPLPQFLGQHLPRDAAFGDEDDAR